MTNSPYVRSKLAQAGLALMPPLIRETLLEDPSFNEEYGLKANFNISFGDSGISFLRSNLIEAAQKMLSGGPIMEITAKDGHKWMLKEISEEGEFQKFTLSRDDQLIILPDFLTAFSPDSNTRLRFVDKVGSEVNLPSSARDVWRKVLTERSLEDEEIDLFNNDIRDTPVQFMRIITDEIANDQIKISSLVPPSAKYFHRLVGEYDGSVSIQDYAANIGKSHFQKLFAWEPYDGFLLSLLLSSHSSLTVEINLDPLSSEDLLRAFEFLIEHGDRTSQLGAIEVGFRILPSRPEIEPNLIHLIENIRDDDVDEQGNGFKLFSALFILVGGEMSRVRLLSAEPPFYRRLAALSQAALIHRQLLNSEVDIDSFSKWVMSNLSRHFYLQSLTDMRMEPCWNPEYAAPLQTKADFIGRILNAASEYKDNIKGKELFDLVFGNEPGSLNSVCEFPFQYFPGPLEGAKGTQPNLPADMSESIEKQLNEKEIELKSFIGLVNAAMLFSIDADKAELAARALKLGSNRLSNIEDRSQFIATLNGLSMAAAVSRSRELADELRILVRKYRRDAQHTLSMEEAVNICFVAASSCADLSEWRDFAGEWFTELAFSDLEGNDGEVLQSYLEGLCHAVPELWVSCGRADAALTAFNTR